MKFSVILIFSLMLLSCGNDYGDLVVGENLSVYYTNENDAELAKSIALYWKDNNLLTNENQDVQIIREGTNLRLNIIANNPNEVRNIPFGERIILMDLQNNLRSELNEMSLQLIICDANFKPLYNINK